MIICIEYWKGDIYLTGKKVSLPELKKQIRTAEALYDPIEDNLVDLLCRMYNWERAEETVPDYTYDRDTLMIF